MAQNIKIGVSTETSGAEKGVDAVEKSTLGLADALKKVDSAGAKAEKRLENIAALAKRLSKELGSNVSENDARRFQDNFDRIKKGRGPGSGRVRDFEDFDSWDRGAARTFKRPGDAWAHRARVFARGMQGTSWAANQPPGPPPIAQPGVGGGGGGGGRMPGLARTAMSMGGSLLGLAGIASTISGLVGMIGQGVASATDEATTLDTLKRRLSNSGSYGDLQQSMRGAAAGMGISYVDSARYGSSYARASGRGGRGWADGLRTSYGMSRSFGVDPAEGAEFFGGMAKLGVSKDDAGQRKLATLIADAIERGGFTAKAEEVMRAVGDYASVAARASLTTPNVGAYLAGLTSLTAPNIPGLDPAGAANLLGKTDSAIRRGGAMGEASQNLSYMALANGYSPVVAQIMESGGMFGSADSIFGLPNTVDKDGKPKHNRTAMGDWADENHIATPSGGMSNFDKEQLILKGQTGNNPEMLTLAMEGQYGVTANEAIELKRMTTGDQEASARLIAASGIDINKMTSMSGMAGIAKVANASSMGGLTGLFNETMGRRDVSENDRAALKALFDSGDLDHTKKALTQVYAAKGQAGTEGSEIRTSIVDLKDVLTNIGDKALPLIGSIKDAVVALASVFGSQDYKGKAQAESDAKTDFGQRVRDSRGGDRLSAITGWADSEYDNAVKAAGGGPIDINSLAKVPEGLNPSSDSYVAMHARQQHLMGRFNKDFGDSRAKQMVDYYSKNGWTHDQSIGIAAVALAESGFDEHAIGDNKTAVGLFQWHPDRQKAIEEHFHKRILDMDFAEQMKANNWELHGPERAAGLALGETTGVGDAASVYTLMDSRPANKGYKAAERAGMAEDMSRRLLAGSMTMPDGASAGGSGDVINIHMTSEPLVVHDQNGNVRASGKATLMQMPSAPSASGSSYLQRPL
jgi:hypothetical protein